MESSLRQGRTNCIVKNETDPKPEWDPSVRILNSMHWLVNNRHDLGPNGWERLVGKKNMKCKSTTGNHLTMMREPVVSLELFLECP